MKSARHPLSTQIPLWSYPHVFPWMHGDPLRWFVICTPPAVMALQRCRPPSFDEHEIVCPPEPGPAFPASKKSARHPRSTQIPRLS
jgi:hypothetical protein